MKRISFLFCLFYVNGIVQAQELSASFLKHLSREKLQLEQKCFLDKLPQNDSTAYLFAKYHLQYGHWNDIKPWFQKGKAYFLRDSLSVGYALTFLLKECKMPSDEKQFFLSELNPEMLSPAAKGIFDLIHINLNKPLAIPTSQYPSIISNDLKILSHSLQKKPVVAALLSATIPGLGKYYIGKPRMALNTFVQNALLGFQTYESIHKLGVVHPLSIVNIVLSALFYSANIYGSYRDSIYFKKENYHQLTLHAYDYYYSQYYSDLYR